MTPHTDERAFAIDLARQAGAIMQTNYTLGMAKEWKADGSPLTVTDTAINDLVLRSVRAAYPTHGVLAEEGSDHHESQRDVWVCDPVDGTIAFSHGIPNACFLLALVRDGQSVLGVAYNPFQNRLLVGEKGKGATLNDSPIHVSPERRLQDSMICFESWYSSTYDILDVRQLLEANRVNAFALGSAGYETMLVALGETVAAVFPHNTPWDIAATKVIVEEAGGKVTDLFGEDQRYDRPTRGYVATNGLVHDELITLIGSPKAR